VCTGRARFSVIIWDSFLGWWVSFDSDWMNPATRPASQSPAELHGRAGRALFERNADPFLVPPHKAAERPVPVRYYS
jgi:hypothetical protein